MLGESNKKSKDKYLSADDKLVRDKISKMTPKEKRVYYLHYYKLHGLALIIVVLIFGNLLYTIVFNPDNEIVLNAVVYTNYIEDQGLEALRVKLEEALEIDLDIEEVNVSLIMKNEDNSMSQYSPEIVLLSRLAAKDIDILITNKIHFESLVKDEAFLSLDDYIKGSIIDIPIVEQVVAKGADSVERIYGINLSEDDHAQLNANQELVVGVVVNTNNLDNALIGLEKLMNESK